MKNFGEIIKHMKTLKRNCTITTISDGSEQFYRAIIISFVLLLLVRFLN